MRVRGSMLRALTAATMGLAMLVPAAGAADRESPKEPFSYERGAGTQVTELGSTFSVKTRSGFVCPGTAGPGGCTVRTTAEGFVMRPGAGIRMAVIGTATATVPAGATLPVAFRLNEVGAQTLRTGGIIRARLTVVGGEAADPDTAVAFSDDQFLRVPAKVLTERTRVRSVTLAANGRLILRLAGASGSTGYQWRFTASGDRNGPSLAEERTTPCPSDAIGCPYITEAVYVSGFRGASTTVTASLRGPSGGAPVRRLTLRIVSSGDPAIVPHLVSGRHDGSRVHVTIEQPLVVRLFGEDPTTGRAWRVLDGGLDPFSIRRYEDCASRCGLVRSEFAFRPGGTVRLGLFDVGATEPLRTFSVTVEAMGVVA